VVDSAGYHLNPPTDALFGHCPRACIVDLKSIRICQNPDLAHADAGTFSTRITQMNGQLAMRSYIAGDQTWQIPDQRGYADYLHNAVS
jgi:hypothetical protein